MPDDNDKLNNEAMYGASKSMQVLRSHVGIGSFIECLSAATRTIVQTTSVVTGITRISSSFRRSPSAFTGGASNQSPECGDREAKRRARSRSVVGESCKVVHTLFLQWLSL